MTRDPPANRSPEAVALRQAAMVFAKNAAAPVSDYLDSRGQILNRALLLSALHYATAVDRVQRPPLGRTQQTLLTHLRSRAPRGSKPADWPRISNEALQDLFNRDLVEWAGRGRNAALFLTGAGRAVQLMSPAAQSARRKVLARLGSAARMSGSQRRKLAAELDP